MTSFIYNGTVIHKRFKPKVHFFKYKVFSFLIDLSELETLDKTIKFFSYNKFNLVSFFDKDHGDRDGSLLTNWVKKNLKQNDINYQNIKIKLLCYPRIFGYVFNPLSVFYVYDNYDNLISILYEVKILLVSSILMFLKLKMIICYNTIVRKSSTSHHLLR